MVCVLGSRFDIWLLVTFFFCAFSDTLRATDTQYRFTAVLGRCVLFYLINRMGHA